MQLALTTLRQAIDEGWCVGWWYYLELEPSLESIRNEPEFQAMLAVIKADTRVRAEGPPFDSTRQSTFGSLASCLIVKSKLP